MGNLQSLTPLEKTLLNLLVENRGRVVDLPAFAEADPAFSNLNELRFYIHTVRRKIQGQIVNVFNVGYRYDG